MDARRNLIFLVLGVSPVRFIRGLDPAAARSISYNSLRKKRKIVSIHVINGHNCGIPFIEY